MNMFLTVPNVGSKSFRELFYSLLACSFCSFSLLLMGKLWQQKGLPLIEAGVKAANPPHVFGKNKPLIHSSLFRLDKPLAFFFRPDHPLLDNRVDEPRSFRKICLNRVEHSCRLGNGARFYALCIIFFTAAWNFSCTYCFSV